MQISELVRPFLRHSISGGNGSVSISSTFIRTATKRAAGSKTSMKDSAGRRLGAKAGDGQLVQVGEIVYRQRGTKIYPGENMGIGRDHTLFAKEPGYVRYYYDPFHPKRKLVGIAMDKEARLPTPHFAPRRRRFGYDVITDPVKADRERNVMKRKEYLAHEEWVKSFQSREEKRAASAKVLTNKMKELGVAIEDASGAETMGNRLLLIQRMLAQGRPIEEARALVDRDAEHDAKIAQEFRKDSTLIEKLPKYKEMAALVDSTVTFDPENQLIKQLSTEELDQLAKETTKKLESIIASDGTVKELYSQIQEAVKQPCFSLKERHLLTKRYYAALKSKNSPRKLPEEEMNKLVKEKKGKIVKKWNYERRVVEQVFVPLVNNAL